MNTHAVRSAVLILIALWPVLGATGLVVWIDSPLAGALVALLSWLPVVGLVVAGLVRAYPHSSFGAANVVTTLRAAAVVALLILLFRPGPIPLPSWEMAILAGGILALDGLDGFLARRQGTVSAFGARFDVEVDSAFALILCCLIWKSDVAGASIFALGLLRYVFVVAAAFEPRLRAPLPPSMLRKAICVLQIGTLCLLLVPVLPEPVAVALQATATAALVWSFGRDVIWLVRTGPAQRARQSQATPGSAPKMQAKP